MTVSDAVQRLAGAGWEQRAFDLVASLRPGAAPALVLLQALADSERLVSYLHAMQAAVMAALAVPGVCGDARLLAEALSEFGGIARGLDGQVDPDRLEVVVAEQAQRLAAAEVAVAMRISPLAATRRVGSAVELVGELPATLAALRDGLIDRGRAGVIAERTAVLDPADRRVVEQRVLPLAGERSVSRVRQLCDRAVIALAPDAAARRAGRARRERDVVCRPLPDGMAMISARLPAEGAHAVADLLDVIADADRDRVDRPIGARRADALTGIAEHLLARGTVDLCDLIPTIPAATTAAATPASPAPVAPAVPLGSGAVLDTGAPGAEVQTASPAETTAGTDDLVPSGARSPEQAPARSRPRRQGRPVDLVVTMALSTLIGLDDLPANLQGYGAMTADWGRTVAAAARSVTVLALDPATGTPAGIGQRTHRPRQRLRDAVITLDRTCIWPGCAAPSWRCDVDHRRPFDHHHPDRGGPTAASNLDPLCRQHHLLKTHGGWTLHRNTDRTITVNSPAGQNTTHPATEITLPGEWNQPDPTNPGNPTTTPNPATPAIPAGSDNPSGDATPATAIAAVGAAGAVGRAGGSANLGESSQANSSRTIAAFLGLPDEPPF